eukprot:4416186-Amphidinium_carterae.1
MACSCMVGHLDVRLYIARVKKKASQDAKGAAVPAKYATNKIGDRQNLRRMLGRDCSQRVQQPIAVMESGRALTSDQGLIAA